MDTAKVTPHPLESHLAKPLEFTFLTTRDGSPTVRFGRGPGASEAMHSLRGALAETLYIYGTAIDRALALNIEPRVLSLGLGLGYVEILTVALTLRFAKSLQSRELDHALSAEISSNFLSRVGGESFELFEDLRAWFFNWACSEGNVPHEFLSTYDLILEMTSCEVNVPAGEIRNFLRELLKSGRWKLRPQLEVTTSFETHSFGVICFDAFSSKTSPQLWDESFLKSFFSKTFAPRAMLSTYACTGDLKRSLRDCGFVVNIRPGFAGKRSSTLAVRNPEIT